MVLPADPPMAPVEPRRPRLLVMLQIAAAVALGALLGLSYVRYRLPSSPATTSVVEIEPPATNPAASRESTPSTPAAGVEATSVRRVLNAYAHAYDWLDALAASALWPGVDRPALSRVFDSVSSQRVTLTRCDITIAASAPRRNAPASSNSSPASATPARSLGTSTGPSTLTARPAYGESPP